jgi:MFS family permease
VSIIGGVNTGGMVFFGIIADWKMIDKVRFVCSRSSVCMCVQTLLYGVSTCACGVCVLLMPFVESFTVAAILCSLFGLFISANYTLASVIILELMSINDFCAAYGLVGFVEGIGTLIGPALAGG